MAADAVEAALFRERGFFIGSGRWPLPRCGWAIQRELNYQATHAAAALALFATLDRNSALEKKVSTQNKPRKGEFFAVTLDSRRPGPGHGVVFENEKELLTPPKRSLRPPEGGFPALRETPRLVYDPREGDMPQDLEGSFGGYWLVSDRLKQVFEKVDPQAFEFAETDFRLADGSRGPSYFLCDVVRVLDAVDESASKLKVKTGNEYINGKAYKFGGTVSLAFKREVTSSFHAFRLPFSAPGLFLFIDKLMLDALRQAEISTGENSGGLWVLDSADWIDV